MFDEFALKHPTEQYFFANSGQNGNHQHRHYELRGCGKNRHKFGQAGPLVFLTAHPLLHATQRIGERHALIPFDDQTIERHESQHSQQCQSPKRNGGTPTGLKIGCLLYTSRCV